MPGPRDRQGPAEERAARGVDGLVTSSWLAVLGWTSLPVDAAGDGGDLAEVRELLGDAAVAEGREGGVILGASNSRTGACAYREARARSACDERSWLLPW